MSHQVVYHEIRGYVNDRPLVNIYCHGLREGAFRRQMIARLDTGADYLVLPTFVAAKVGLDLANYRGESIETAGGYAVAITVPGFWVEIDDLLVRVEAQFVDLLPTTRALVGWSAILAAMDVGFDVRQWFYKP